MGKAVRLSEHEHLSTIESATQRALAETTHFGTRARRNLRSAHHPPLCSSMPSSKAESLRGFKYVRRNKAATSTASFSYEDVATPVPSKKASRQKKPQQQQQPLAVAAAVASAAAAAAAAPGDGGTSKPAAPAAAPPAAAAGGKQPKPAPPASSPIAAHVRHDPNAKTRPSKRRGPVESSEPAAALAEAAKRKKTLKLSHGKQAKQPADEVEEVELNGACDAQWVDSAGRRCLSVLWGMHCF
jgi:hypothetical protein